MRSALLWKVAAVGFGAITMLTAVGLVSTGGWLISMAALMPPILLLQVAIVSVRAFGISRAVFRWLERVASHEVALTGVTELRVRLWEAAAALGPRGVWRMRGSDALDRLTADTETMQDDVTRVRVPFAAATVAAVVLVLVQWSLLPTAGLALAAAFLVSGILVPAVTVTVETRVASSALTVRNRISAIVADAASRGNEFQVLGLADDLQRDLADADRQRVRIESAAGNWSALSGAVNGLVAGAATFFSLAAAIAAHDQGELKGPLIAVICLLPWSAAEIIATFSQAATARTKVQLAKSRIGALLDDAEGRLAEIGPRQQIIASASVFEADRVTVSWDGKPAVSDISFEVHRGERLAIVGPSGSGKSSLAAALLRLVEHDGAITLNSIPVSRLSDYRSHVTAVLQTTHIFHVSVSENLKVAAPHATEAQMRQALVDAGLSDWFGSLDNGLETELGDGGRGMSGGEVQRFGLARALLTDAAFIILDEPTEHLDQETADAIWQSVNRLFTDRGLIIISHDPVIALDCDEVMVLHEGRVIEHGHPDELAEDGWLHRMSDSSGRFPA